MCNSNNNLAGSLLPFGLKLSAPGQGAPTHGGLLAPAGHPFVAAAGGPPAPGGGGGGLTPAALELHRAQAQLYDYNARLRFGLHYAAAAAAAAGHHPGLAGTPFPPAAHHPGHPHPPGAGDPMAAYLYGKQVGDPRLRYLHEEPKPSHSYIGLIAMAILSSKDKKLVLSDIYQWILDNYPYFRTRGPGWRNSIRHNLSLNDCFIKAGRSANGKGHYWAIHPANVDDFGKGDFRRRRAQRKVRKAMGLAVPDEEDSPSPPPPTLTGTPLDWQNRILLQQQQQQQQQQQGAGGSGVSPGGGREEDGGRSPSSPPPPPPSARGGGGGVAPPARSPAAPSVGGGHKKRLFDVESLLAPDNVEPCPPPQPRGPTPSPPPAPKTEEDIVEVDSKPGSPALPLSPAPAPRGLPEQQEGGPSRTPSLPSTPGSSPRLDAKRRADSPPGPPPPLHRLPLPTQHPHHPHPVWTWPPAAPSEHRPAAHPSAFHAFPGAIPAWGALHPQGYPLLAGAALAPAPAPTARGGAGPGTAEEAAHKWQEAFSRIMSRSQEPPPPASPLSPPATTSPAAASAPPAKMDQ